VSNTVKPTDDAHKRVPVVAIVVPVGVVVVFAVVAGGVYCWRRGKDGKLGDGMREPLRLQSDEAGVVDI
jgi:hypothetical protein